MPVVSPAYAGLVGQEQAVTLLSQAVQRQRLAPAYLFMGPDGVGRALVARGLIRQLLARSSRSSPENHPDLLWIEPTYLHQGKMIRQSQAQDNEKTKARPQIRLEQIRELVRFLARPPLEAERSLVVIEQAETMAEGAANGLLKTLEEPGQATLILLAPNETALLPTLVSRCQRIPFMRLTEAQMVQVLTQLGKMDILQEPQILQLAQGSPGAALQHWQQWQAIPAELQAACLQQPTTPRQALELAKQISQTLELETQLWLLAYLQQVFWQQSYDSRWLYPLETARQQLLSYAQPQLVWEVVWLSLRRE